MEIIFLMDDYYNLQIYLVKIGNYKVSKVSKECSKNFELITIHVFRLITIVFYTIFAYLHSKV